ncbi:MAG: hypothetical protein F6K10_31050 [Moorea sp. SIO2B7]|nr:hypothetical protein [Moorena sp. SIO2B7]
MNSYLQQRYQEKRINFFTKVIGTTLMLFGIFAVVVQIVKAFLDREFNYSLLFASIFGILLIILGRKEIIVKIVKYSIFQGKKRMKIFIFLFPFFLSGVMILLKSIVESDSWKRMNAEGGFIEYGTSLAYILAFIFAIPIGNFLFK